MKEPNFQPLKNVSRNFSLNPTVCLFLPQGWLHVSVTVWASHFCHNAQGLKFVSCNYFHKFKLVWIFLRNLFLKMFRLNCLREKSLWPVPLCKPFKGLVAGTSSLVYADLYLWYLNNLTVAKVNNWRLKYGLSLPHIIQTMQTVLEWVEMVYLSFVWYTCKSAQIIKKIWTCIGYR